jgi:hypothetical protein
MTADKPIRSAEPPDGPAEPEPVTTDPPPDEPFDPPELEPATFELPDLDYDKRDLHREDER